MYQSKELSNQQLLMICREIIVCKKSIRSLAQKHEVSKSYLHCRLHKEIPKHSLSLYFELKKAFRRNYMEKHIKGGLATKRKWEKIKAKDKI